MRSKPQTASERLVKTTEWVLKNNGIEELQYEGKFLSSLVYYNIDVLILCISIPVVIFAVLRLSDFRITVDRKKKEE